MLYRIIIFAGWILAAYLVVLLSDNVGVKMKETNGVVIEKDYIGSYSLPMWIGSIVFFQTYPEARWVCVQTEISSGCTSTSKEDYDALSNGSHVRVTYSYGSLTGDFHVRRISRYQ